MRRPYAIGSRSIPFPSMRKAASSPVERLRIKNGRPAHKPMRSTSVRDGFAGDAGWEWTTASS